MTNSWKYAPGPSLLTLDLGSSSLEVTVWVTGATLPVVHASQPDRIGRHGMEVVLALCEAYEVRREPVGKRIRVRISMNGSHTATSTGPRSP